MLFLEPTWWYVSKPSWQSYLLSPISFLWGKFASQRMKYPAKIISPVPVICVGNFTAGGSGKTPASIFLARELLSLGYKPIFLTRGYGASYSREARYVDKNIHTAKEVGDEPLLLAEVAPVMVSADRARGIKTVLQSDRKANIIIMDDGLQNSSIKKNCSIAVVNDQRGLGNQKVIPSGPLRAPLEDQLDHVDIIILNKGNETKSEKTVELVLKSKFNRKIYHAYTEPACNYQWLRGERVLAYAGIAHPDRFYKLLKELGALILGYKTFPDHHRFTDSEACDLIKKAEKEKCTLVTTEKDWVRLSNSGENLERLKAASKYLPIVLNMELEEKKMFLEKVKSLI